jgi:hypothetical protein
MTPSKPNKIAAGDWAFNICLTNSLFFSLDFDFGCVLFLGGNPETVDRCNGVFTDPLGNL